MDLLPSYLYPGLSATALMMLAFYNRYTAIVSRIHSVDRELLGSPPPSLRNENQYQSRVLLRRAQVMRFAITSLHVSSVLFSCNGLVALISFQSYSATSRALLSMSFGCMGLTSLLGLYEGYLSMHSILHERDNLVISV